MLLTRWKNIYLVVVLAFLQCFAPLLHAHTLGMTHIDGVHFHFDNDMLDHDDIEAGKPVLQISKTEFPAIGMAQEYKKDYGFFITDDLGALPPALTTPFLTALSLSVAGQLHQITFRFYHPLPFSQAPPAPLY